MQVRLEVWAPTSHSVELLLFEGPRNGEPEAHQMNRGDDGVWRVSGPDWWKGRFYLYRLRNYSPLTGSIETCTAPDPYSRAVSADGKRSQVRGLMAPPSVRGMYLPGAYAALPVGFVVDGASRFPVGASDGQSG